MCSTHTNRQDGGGGPRGARVCKGGNVLKASELMEDVAVREYVLASFNPEKQYLACVSSCVALVFLDIL